MPALIAAVTLLAAPLPAGAETAAETLADQVIEALGGRARFDAVRGLRWSFGSSVNDTLRGTRRHAWDRTTGWHKVEGIGRDGVRYVFAHVIGDSTRGWATMNGQRIEGDSLRTLRRRAYAMWVNDSYWLLMPYKLRDPGVRLALAPDTTLGDVRHPRLALSFDGVGLTPGDRYWVSVHPRTHRVVLWEYVLQGQTGPPVAWEWDGWQTHGGLQFATLRRGPAGSARAGTMILTNGLEVVDRFGDDEFRAP